MNAFTLDPILPFYALAVLGVLIIALGVGSFFRPSRGRWLRLLSCLIILIALLNPTVTTTNSRPLKDIVLVLVDKSSSQAINERTQQTEQARRYLNKELGRFRDLDIRFVDLITDGREDTLGTRALSALKQASTGIDPARFAGAILLSDGQVHDVESHIIDGLYAPLHVILSGHKDDLDRRLEVIDAPRFGLVDKALTLKFQVLDNAVINPKAPLSVTLPDGTSQNIIARSDGIFEVEYTPKHAGPSVLVVETDTLDGEISTANNRVALNVNGVHDRLRVLLVSGLPHQGQRTWRNILRSDPAVDLVHFTILRPSDKEDFTPLNELSLIAFPVRELFEEKLNDFDLIIFDRYYKHNVLSEGYFENIREYVENGGALLISAGPDFAGARSLAHTRLKDLLPAEPTGQVQEDRAFSLKRTTIGHRHPISAGLEGQEKNWGRWMRLVEVNQLQGDTLLESDDKKPILVVERIQDGRLALLLSDHTWLWARGFDGGGPHLDLVRHLVHWLMKEPDLEEESLRLISTDDNGLIIKRQSLKTTDKTVTLTHPDDRSEELTLKPASQGAYSTQLSGLPPGVYKAQSGDLTNMVTVGALNPKELQDPRASAAPLQPVVSQLGGSIHWMEDALPSLRRISRDETPGANNWIGLVANKAEAVIGIKTTPLLPAWAIFLLAGGLWIWGWWRESR